MEGAEPKEHRIFYKANDLFWLRERVCFCFFFIVIWGVWTDKILSQVTGLLGSSWALTKVFLNAELDQLWKYPAVL